MRKAAAVFSLLILFLNFPKTIWAATLVSFSPPEAITQEETFNISVDISASADTDYFIKIRTGSQTTKLTQAETFNPTTSIWLNDSSAWTSFPTFKTDLLGKWSGVVQARVSSSALVGSNFIAVRIRKTVTTTTYDSDNKTITINAKPLPPPSQLTGSPILNEFLPQPETGGKEWVEIKNIGSETADLSGWQIDDEEGKSTPEVLATGTILAPNGFLVVTFSSSKLNDSTDSVRLLKPDDSVVESFTYANTEKGKSWAKDSRGSWFLTAAISPNAQNPDLPKPTIAQPANTTTKVSNTKPTPSIATISANSVNQLPNVLGAKDEKTPTVSSNFSDKKSNSTIFFPLIIFGFLLIAGSGIYLVKKKSGRSENSDQPL